MIILLASMGVSQQCCHLVVGTETSKLLPSSQVWSLAAFHCGLSLAGPGGLKGVAQRQKKEAAALHSELKTPECHLTSFMVKSKKKWRSSFHRRGELLFLSLSFFFLSSFLLQRGCSFGDSLQYLSC